MAGCQTVIQAVKSVLVEYTEFHYTSTAPADTKFVPLQFGYLPEGLDEIEREENEDSIDLLYMDETTGQYFNIYQKMLIEDTDSTYGIDTENAETEIIWIVGESIFLVEKDGRFYFDWLHDVYHISGQTNLSKKELTVILAQITF